MTTPQQGNGSTWISLTVDLERDLASAAKVDPKTVRRWAKRLEVRRGTRERLEAAYAQLTGKPMNAQGAT